MSTANRCRIALLPACLFLTLATAARAGSQDEARILLHVQAPIAKASCTAGPLGQGIPCSDYVTAALAGQPYYAYLMVARADPDSGIGGLSCGIDYNPAPGEGVGAVSWTLCSGGLEFPNAGPYGMWPMAQGGTRITWDHTVNCQRTVVGEDGVHATAGFFYVYAYSADTLRVVRNENLESGPEVGVGDCRARFSSLPYDALGSIVFTPDGTEGGCNPCLDPCPDPPPPRKAECLLEPAVIDFGYVPIDTTRDTTVVLTNIGTAPLAGYASGEYTRTGYVATVEFGPEGPYELLPGESTSFYISFRPFKAGSYFSRARITPCEDLILRGYGDPGPSTPADSCLVIGTDIDFGAVAIGETAIRLFRIYNPDTDPLRGSLEFDCQGYTLLGTPLYNLDPNRHQSFILHFEPDHPGEYPCRVYLDGPCPSVDLRGRAGYPQEVAIDVLPGVCPNTIRPRLSREVEVVVLGSADFDPTLVDIPTVSVNNEAKPREVDVEDIAQPGLGAPRTVAASSGACECTSSGLSPDGYPDLTLRFAVEDLAAAYDDSQGREGTLRVTAILADTLVLTGTDCIRWEGFPLDHGPGAAEVEEAPPAPARDALSIHPGPPEATHQRITYTQPSPGRIRIQVFDVAGRRVAEILDGVEPAGRRSVEWDTGGLSSGIYFYRMQTEQGTRTRKALLLH